MNTESTILTSMSKTEFLESYQNIYNNIEEGLILKFGAEWCSPCKRIEPLVKRLMLQTPSSIKCALIDIDEDFELYALFKSKRLINGVPAIFGYKKGNTTGRPDNLVVGADEEQINGFFQNYIVINQK
jgi:thiol-disulfide isomerase/thioredoxin